MAVLNMREGQSLIDGIIGVIKHSLFSTYMVLGHANMTVQEGADFLLQLASHLSRDQLYCSGVDGRS